MGDDDARARATLTEMQERISRGPYGTLGIAEHATVEDVRAAFLALTKRFHPARFGRLANDVQRLSNEVFLGIKAAHDMLMKQLGATRNPSQSGGMSVITDAKTSGAIPAVRAGTPSPARTTAAIPPTARPGTPPLARGTDRPPERQSAPVVSRAPTPVAAVPPARTTSPIAVARPSTPSQRAPTPPQRPPSASAAALNPDTVRGVVAPREPAFDERAALREALMHLNEQAWSEARQSLSTLAAKVPQSKNYRALLGYARGREAQAAGRADEAALEFQRALELDPQLAMAKQALAEVQRRR